MQSRVLIVDDDAEVREALGLALSTNGHAYELAGDAVNALEIVERQPFDAVICDVLLDGMSGLELLDRVKRSHPALPFIVITARGGVPQAVDAIKRGAFEYMTKPCMPDELLRIVAAAVDGRKPAEVVRSQLPQSLGSLVGNGPAMRALNANIDLVARSSGTVLIMGETGAGKELVARAIHARGARQGRPFVAVNMSAIPPELLEGEIFGHVRGAFTGAALARKGLFAEADGGTLLLDEIGDMSFDLQAKLLRVVQFGEIRRVGSERVQHVDVRVIAATHRNLPALVRDGRFREDLYFRLDVLPVFVPPLRAHREDIPALAEHFLEQARARAPSSPVRAIGPDALRILCDAPWPGNVRELASAIERAVVFGMTETIDATHLAAATLEGAPQAWPFRSDAPWTLRKLSLAYTDWVLGQTNGNKERAAAILGIDLSTLYRWQRSRD